MALTERTRPYETLIRHNANGEIGSHHATITEVLRDGVIVSAQVGAPAPLSADQLTDVVSAANSAALAELSALKPELEAAKSKIMQLTDELAKLKQPPDELAKAKQAAADQGTTG